jgi:cell division protein FtsL
MKSLKEYFRMIITAVICFAVNLVSGKKGQAEVLQTVLTCGQAVSGKKKGQEAVSANIKSSRKNQNMDLSFIYGWKTLSNRSSNLKRYGDKTDITIGSSTHIRAPDTGARVLPA